jgi:two-component system chemotaxis response regulator CheB
VRAKDIIVIGTSAGGIEALQKLLANLPEDFPASVFIVLHTSPNSPSVLAGILDAAGPLPAAFAVHRQRIQPGRVYVAPPDHHLIIVPGSVELSRGPKENRFRPAVDPLFRSAAQTYGPRVIGVVLTGGLDDGTNGLWTVKQLGGTAVVQDPSEAMAPSMPLSASRHVNVDHTVRIAELAPLLVHLTAAPLESAEGEMAVPEHVKIEVNIARDTDRDGGIFKLGDPSRYACPECHGVLLRLTEAAPVRFRCHTGHAYTIESLLAEMDDMIEDALWNAIRALEEQAMLIRHASEMHMERDRLTKSAENSDRRADLVRRAVVLAVPAVEAGGERR